MKNPIEPKIEFLEDVPLKVNAKLGSVKKLLLEVLSLKEGDIIDLGKNIEEYLDIDVNGKKFAIGEMVVANEKYGIRIVDLA